MAIYVYVPISGEGETIEILTHDYEPHKHCPEGYRLSIQTSTLVMGDFEVGDDDFSTRYRLNGASEAAKPNRTQGKTNVNAILRKWGPKGKPLEARTDIDSTKITKGGLRPPGVKSSLEAPPELRSSSAKGISSSEVSR